MPVLGYPPGFWWQRLRTCWWRTRFPVGRRLLCLFLSESGVLCYLLPVEVSNDPCNVRLRFVVRRNAVILVDASGARIVGSQRFVHVEVIFLQQLAQVLASALDIRARVERIRYSHL